MLSFYEFDRLVRKKNGKLRTEALSDAARQRAAALQAKVNAARTAKLPQTQTNDVEGLGSEPEEPVSVTQSTTPPPAAPTSNVNLNPPAPAAPTGAPASRPLGDKGRGKLATSGSADQNIIRSKHDINDPDSPEMQALRASDSQDGGRRLGKSRNRSGSMGTASGNRSDELAGRIANDLEICNNMTAGRMGPGGKSVSDWAAHIQWFLEQDYDIPELHDCNDGSKIKFGEPFQFVLAPGSGKKNVPEVLINNPQWFKKMWRAFWQKMGGGRSNGGDPSMEKSNGNSVLSKYADEGIAARKAHDEAESRGDQQTMRHMQGKMGYIRRVAKLFNLLDSNHVAGRTYTVDQLVRTLQNAEQAKWTEKNKRATQSGQKELPPPPEPNHERDLHVLIDLLHKAKQSQYPFLEIQGEDIGPHTHVTVIPTDVGRVGDNELRGSVAGGHTSPVEDEHMSAAARAKAHLDRLRGGHDDELSGLGQEPNESRQWMDVFDLMEHWGF